MFEIAWRIQKYNYICKKIKVMKKFLLFLLIPILFGCEIYELESNPQLNLNGPWRIIGIQADYSDGVLDLTHRDGIYAVSPLIVDSITDNGWVAHNDTTGIKPCFLYKNGYVWEFDYNQLIIKNNRDEIIGRYYCYYRSSFYNPNDFFLVDKNTGIEIEGNFNFSYYANGSMPASNLSITIPEINYNLGGTERSMERTITQKITLSLTR